MSNKNLLLITLILFLLLFNFFFFYNLMAQGRGIDLVVENILVNALTKSLEKDFLLDKEISSSPLSIKDSLTNINGIYYLRDYDPLNYTDEGSFNRTQPINNEIVKCGLWILYHFNQLGVYEGVNNITSIYYHLWQNSPGHNGWPSGEIFGVGYSVSGEHAAPYDEFVTINTSNHISEVNGYRLVQTMIFPNQEIATFDGDEIYNFTIRYAGAGPMILGSQNISSFIILNLESNRTLQGYDRDRDKLSDYDELFLYMTNPFDPDTDNDGVLDAREIINNTDPNDYSDY